MGKELGLSDLTCFWGLNDDCGGDGKSEPLVRGCWWPKLYGCDGVDAETDRMRVPDDEAVIEGLTLAWWDLVED